MVGISIKSKKELFNFLDIFYKAFPWKKKSISEEYDFSTDAIVVSDASYETLAQDSSFWGDDEDGVIYTRYGATRSSYLTNGKESTCYTIISEYQYRVNEGVEKELKLQESQAETKELQKEEAEKEAKNPLIITEEIVDNLFKLVSQLRDECGLNRDKSTKKG